MWAAKKIGRAQASLGVGLLSVNPTWSFSKFLVEVPIIKCHENLCSWTDSSDTGDRLISTFYANTPKKIW